jgi:hypothetical protein
VNTVIIDGESVLLTVNIMLAKLQAAVTSIGVDVLGFTADDTGLYSRRSGASVVMYLNNIPVYTLILIGMLSSDAFLHYSRRQVTEFSAGAASAMIKSPDFFTTPQEVSAEEPRTASHHENICARNNCGLSSQSIDKIHPSLPCIADGAPSVWATRCGHNFVSN